MNKKTAEKPNASVKAAAKSESSERKPMEQSRQTDAKTKTALKDERHTKMDKSDQPDMSLSKENLAKIEALGMISHSYNQ